MKQEEIPQIIQNPKAINEDNSPKNFEDILKNSGCFGIYQIFIVILGFSLEIPTALMAFVPIFVGANPKEWFCDEELISSKNVCQCNGTLTGSSESLMSEWGLICDKAWVSDFITSIQMFGMMFGNLYASQLSDWYGRRYTFLGVVLLMGIGSSISAVAPNPYIYAAARLLCGAGLSGFMNVSTMFTMEFMTPKWRPLSGGSAGPFGEGIMLLGLFAYFIRPWRSLIWSTAILFGFVGLIYPLMPESPRWLIRNKRYEEAHKIMVSMAKMNGQTPVEFEVLKEVCEKEGSNEAQQEGALIEKFSYLEFFRNPRLRFISLYLMGIWWSWSITYFGISYNIKNLQGDPYLNVVFLGLADSVGYPLAHWINNKIGRRKSLVFFMTLAATFLALLAIFYLVFDMDNYPYIVLTMCLIGKLGAAGAKSAARLLTGESFPTAVRTMGIGLGGFASNIGGIITPQLAYFGSTSRAIPFFVFAVVSVSGSLISFLMSETRGKPLKDEVEKGSTKTIISIVDLSQDDTKTCN